MTYSARGVQDYISQYAPRWAGPGSEGVRGLSGSCPGCSPLELRVQRTRCRCREDRPLPPAPGAQPFPNPTQPCPVPAANPGVTMNPAVFLSLPDLRCSLLLLVSEWRNDRPFDRLSDGLTPSLRGEHSCLHPCLPIFSSGSEECTLPRCLHSLHPSVRFPGPRYPRPEKPRSEVGSWKLEKLALGEGYVGGSRARSSPFPQANGGCFRLEGSWTCWELELKRTGDRPTVPSHPLPLGRPTGAGVLGISRQSSETVPGLAEGSVVAWCDWLGTRNWRQIWSPPGE